MSNNQSRQSRNGESKSRASNDIINTQQSGTNNNPKRNENIYHYAGKVHVRGLLRRVWRPRYLALGDDGYLRYHESIPPILQQQQYTHSMYNMVHHTHRPKSVLAILDGARVINPYSVVDQHVALPQGVYGFVFRGRPVELSIASGGSSNRRDASRDAVVVPSQNKNDADKHKPAKAVVNAIFPKGTSRRKTAQKIAKAAINPDVCGMVRGCERGSTNSDSSSSLMEYEHDEIDSSNIMQVHVQSASVQSREYLCAVSTAAEAESWVVALRWAAERRRMTKEQRRLNQKFDSLGIGSDDKLIIMGAAARDNEIMNDHNKDYGRESKESLNSEGSWCKTEQRLSDTDAREGNCTTEDPPIRTSDMERDTKESSTSLHSFSMVQDDLADSNVPIENSSLMPTPRAKNLLDSLLVEDSREDEPPSKLFEEKQHLTPMDGATIVITRVCKFQLHLNSVLSQSIPIPLPGNPLDIRYEIDLLLLKDFEPNDSVSSKNTKAVAETMRPKSIEEQLILRSPQDIIRLLHDLKKEFGEGGIHNNEIRENTTYHMESLELLGEIESSLLIALDIKKKINACGKGLAEICDIPVTKNAIYSTLDAVNRAMRSLATHDAICTSHHFQKFLCLDDTVSNNSMKNVKMVQRTDLDGESIDQIVQIWLSVTKTLPSSEIASLYIAIVLQHPIIGPALVLIAIWVLLRCVSIAWFCVSNIFPAISIPVETYVTLVAAAFYFGHGIGKMSPLSEHDLLDITKVRAQRHKHDTTRDKSTASLHGELLDDGDDHSTLMDEINSDSEDALLLPEVESISIGHERLPVLSSPLPKFPENKRISCWSEPDHNIFMVRSKSYLIDRQKMPSAPAIFECRGVDIWLSDNAARNISSHPAMLGGKVHQDDTFIVNFLLPFGNLVAYWSIKPMEKMPPNVAKVWQAFVKGDQEYRDSKLKLLPVVVDGPWIVKKAVGPGTAPAMIGRDLPLQYYFTEATSTKKGIYEVDVLVTASRIARGILNIVKGHTKSLTIAFAFIIEAAEHADLPENILCSFQMHSMHLEDCPCLPELEPSLSDMCD